MKPIEMRSEEARRRLNKKKGYNQKLCFANVSLIFMKWRYKTSCSVHTYV